MSNQLQALCCTCGQIRTYKRARNVTGDCGADTARWHRCTGDLKCRTCGQITRHALLRGGALCDTAEEYQRVALGSVASWPYTGAEDRIRRQYRQGRTQNPLLAHLWSEGSAVEARQAGRDWVISYCGERTQLPPEGTEVCLGLGPIRPTVEEVRWDEEYEDHDTGMSWVEMECVDCYRVANERRIARQRKKLHELLLELLVRTDERVPDGHVDGLIEAIEAAQQTTVPTKDTAR
ncbi:DUF6315 family protein [Mycolicibacterium wolinskyi]|uniref:DUF6315 family protein n=1 Tax=Mycolicibacterium wolinskyi TaxID=59750 RepID=UPI0039179AAA